MWSDFFFFEDQAGCMILDALEGVGGGVRETREERVAIVNARQNERDNKFGDSLSGEIFSDQADATQMEIASTCSVRDKVGHGERGVENNTKVLGRV
jgi:hypothetical protein